MKKALVLVSTLACMGFHAGDAMARRAAVVYDAKVSSTCAPWDGPAVSVQVDLRNTQEKVSFMLWRDGLEDLIDGDTVELDAVQGGMDSPGYARFCAKDAAIKDCKYIKASIQLPKRGDAGTGVISIPLQDETGREIIYPVHPEWIETHAICG